MLQRAGFVGRIGQPLRGLGGAPVLPTLDLDFLNLGLDPRITFTRESNATLIGPDGTLQYAPHNLIRNSTAQGAVVGSPGTAPTNWAVNSTPAGTTFQIVAVGTESGIPYIDVRISGTTTGAITGASFVSFELTTQTVAAPGQTWTGSFYAKRVGGSQANISALAVAVDERSSVGGYLGGATLNIAPTTADLQSQRYTLSRTLANASTERVTTRLIWNVPSGAAIDITLRVAAPQLNIGTLQPYYPTTTAAYQGPRFDHDPVTLAPRGLLIEEQRTNSIRNNTMQGAVAGTPGTLPTNWSILLGGITGLTREIVGVGVEGGITYIEIRIFGTPSASGSYRIFTESVNNIAALTGQTWTHSYFITRVSGSLSGITAFTDVFQEFTSGGGFITEAGVAALTPGTAALSIQRSTTTRTLSGGATTAFVRTGLQLGLSGAAIDITLRIGLPQLELGAFATSVIPTTTAAATRAADVAVMTGANFSSWYNASEGTVFVEAVSPNAGPATDYGYFSLTTASGFGRGYAALARTGAVGFVRRDAVSNVGISVSFSGTPTRLATTISTASGSRSVNGGAINTDSTALTLDPIQVLHIGFNNVVSPPAQNYLNGHIRRIAYYPRRLSNAELQGLTAEMQGAWLFNNPAQSGNLLTSGLI
jgi:hypothetical protein